MDHREKNRLYLWVVPDGPDTFFITAEVAESAALPAGLVVVIPTLLAESYWIHPERLGVAA